MDSFEPKRNALLRIWQIFQKYSDCDHPLTHDDILRYLSRDYGIELERKAVGRNITALKEAGVEIEPSKRGSYLAYREFDDSELRLLVDGVLASKHITAKYSQALIDKLCNLTSVHFRSHVKNVYSVDQWSKSENNQFFLNISIVDEAIEGGKKISFDYNKYGADKKLHKTATHTVSPYQMILHNQRYYLMALSDSRQKISYYRMDKITGMEICEEAATPIRSVEGYESGINYRELASAFPYMFADKIERVEFFVDEDMIDQVIDWFGDHIGIRKSEGRLKVTVNVSPSAMVYWAMQYLNSVEIISPPSLREQIRQNLEKGVEKYK
ncbi:MAG: WYL domain-containing protein [Clostridiales bacterium]|nr:WYL domain-containing protein [Clostridiales bacterium]